MERSLVIRAPRHDRRASAKSGRRPRLAYWLRRHYAHRWPPLSLLDLDRSAKSRHY